MFLTSSQTAKFMIQVLRPQPDWACKPKYDIIILEYSICIDLYIYIYTMYINVWIL